MQSCEEMLCQMLVVMPPLNRYAYVQLFTYNRRGITAAETAHH